MTEDNANIKTVDARVPNPGSNEAIKIGCTCPIVDNRYGDGIHTDSGAILFWYNEDCPIHNGR